MNTCHVGTLSCDIEVSLEIMFHCTYRKKIVFLGGGGGGGEGEGENLSPYVGTTMKQTRSDIISTKIYINVMKEHDILVMFLRLFCRMEFINITNIKQIWCLFELQLRIN